MTPQDVKNYFGSFDLPAEICRVTKEAFKMYQTRGKVAPLSQIRIERYTEQAGKVLKADPDVLDYIDNFFNTKKRPYRKKKRQE